MGKADFFGKKNEWSKIKDGLLQDYLKLYFQKLLTSGSPICYIDAFAGKGIFSDGEKGSPLIAIDVAKEAIARSRGKDAQIYFYFIENKYEKELAQNISGEKNVRTIGGRYEDKIEDVLKNCAGKNLFLYLDPFGIKCLYFDRYRLLQQLRFRSVELLLNLNTFGFLREGCRLLKCRDFDDTLVGFEERQAIEGKKQTNSIANMNRVANGEYWQEIIRSYNDGRIDAFEAEDRFVREYCQQMNGVFSTTINVPIKARKLENMPKYRMVFATNHKHGLIEMACNMARRWKQMQEDERKGQIVLFEMQRDFRGGFLEFNYQEIVLENLTRQFVMYDDYISLLIQKHGVLCEVASINATVKELEKTGQIEVVRDPAITKLGKPCRWIDWKFNNSDHRYLKVRLAI